MGIHMNFHGTRGKQLAVAANALIGIAGKNTADIANFLAVIASVRCNC